MRTATVDVEFKHVASMEFKAESVTVELGEDPYLLLTFERKDDDPDGLELTLQCGGGIIDTEHIQAALRLAMHAMEAE